MCKLLHRILILSFFTASFAFGQVSDLSITKTVANFNPVVGSTVYFTIVANNWGPNSATAVNIQDLLPSGYTFNNSSATVGNYQVVTGVWTIGSMPVSQSETLTISATVNATGFYQNCADIISNQIDPVPSNNVSCATVTPIPSTNVPPIAVNDFITTLEDTPIASIIVANDSDVDGNLSVSTVDLNPTIPGIQVVFTNSNGNWTVDNVGNLTFTPIANFCGVTQISYTISDSLGAVSNSASVIVNVQCVNDPPIVNNENWVVFQNTPITDFVLLNDFDPDGNILSQTIIAGPIYGTVVLNPNQSITYTPNFGFIGMDTIVLQVCDSGVPVPVICAFDTVFITVFPPSNVAPVAFNDSTATNEDSPISWNIGANDSDIDGFIDLATIDLNMSLPGIQNVFSGTNGTWSTDALGNLTYLPNADFCGIDQLNYTINDDDGATSNVALLNVSVTCVNDAPIVDNEFVVTAFNTNASGDLTDQGDTDVDGNLVVNVTPVAGPLPGATISINTDGTFLYTPALNYSGNDMVIVEICDDGAPTPILCVFDTIFIIVLPQVVPPTANLAIAKTANNMNPNVGSSVVFTVTAANLGPDSATNVMVTDMIQNGYTFVSAIPSVGNYDPISGIWDIDTLLVGASATLSVIVNINPFGNYQNCATISGNQQDPATGNNSFCVTPNVFSTVGCMNGSVFCDANNDGIQNNGETGVDNAPLVVTYNGQTQTTVTNSNGDYTLNFLLAANPTSAVVSVSSSWLAQNGYQYVSNSQSLPILGCGQNTNVNFPVNCDSVQVYQNCVSGWVFCDANTNGNLDSGEVTIPNAPIQINITGMPTVTFFTDSSGYYNYSTGLTNVVNAVVGIPYYWLYQNGYLMNPSSVFVNTACDSAAPTNLAVTCPPNPCANLYSNVSVPGPYFQNQAATISLFWGNLGFSSAQSYILKLIYPSVVTPVLSSINNTNYIISGDTIIWTFTGSNTSNFNMNEIMQFNVPAGIPSGVQHTYSVSIEPTGLISDCYLPNNVYSVIRTIGNSYDPNDKAVNKPLNIDPFIPEELMYTVRFQNTGTAPAQDIYILDTLSPYLDWSTFKVEYFSHYMNVVNLPNGVKKFDFPGIWLPDSTTNEPLSHGYFVYSIKEKVNNSIGSIIENTAYIYFDWNPAIITNTTVNVNAYLGLDDLEANEVNVYPNPFADKLEIVSAKRMNQITVLDITGKSILEKSVDDYNSTIDLSELSQGTYLVRVMSGTEISTVRIIKN